MLYEIKVPGDSLSSTNLESEGANATNSLGRVRYLHGLGIDQPLVASKHQSVTVLAHGAAAASLIPPEELPHYPREASRVLREDVVSRTGEGDPAGPRQRRNPLLRRS